MANTTSSFERHPQNHISISKSASKLLFVVKRNNEYHYVTTDVLLNHFPQTGRLQQPFKIRPPKRLTHSRIRNHRPKGSTIQKCFLLLIRTVLFYWSWIQSYFKGITVLHWSTSIKACPYKCIEYHEAPFDVHRRSSIMSRAIRF